MTMKLKKSKGKVHPSPAAAAAAAAVSSSSSSSSSSDPACALNQLLPAAILTLISVLSFQDRQVLAYMITRSLKPALSFDDNTNTNRKRKPKKSAPPHISPTFDCGCFECYTSYWFRWDSSPHRELIHQAIEAFEEHISCAERTHSNSSKDKDKDKDKDRVKVEPAVIVEAVEEVGSPEKDETALTVKEKEMSRRQEQEQEQHKGLARKMLPDVIGLWNSRLWNLWGPNA